MPRRPVLFALILLLLFPVTGASQSWIWAKQVYGPDKDEILGVATDPAGNVYICGGYQDTIRFSASSWFTGNATYHQGFLAKYDSSGAFLWARNFGGNHHDYASAICTDDSGYVYVACYARSSNQVSFDTFSFTGTGNDKTFILKLNPSGNLVWGKLLTAGTSNAYPTSIAVNNDILAISGNYAFLDLIVETDTLPLWGSEDIFIAACNALNGSLLWARPVQSQYADYAGDVAVDEVGNVLLTGIFNGTLSIGGADTLHTPYGYETFLCKHSTAGNYMWSRRYSGTGDHLTDAMKVNTAGDIYIAGWHGSGSHVLNDTSFSTLYTYNFYLQKVSPSGSSYWTRHYSGGSLGRIIGMSVDPADHVYISGYLGSQFNIDSFQVVGYSNDYRTFIARIDGYGNVVHAIDGGNRVNNSGYNTIATDHFGNAYIIGYFGSATGHQSVFGDDTLVSLGESDGYFAKYGIPGIFPCLAHAGFSYAQYPLCTADSLQLINASWYTDTYQWFVNGVFFTYQEHPCLWLPNPGPVEIMLVSSNALCSDTAIVNIYVHQKWSEQRFDSICNGDSYFIANQYLTQTGTYFFKLLTSAGCDSAITLHLWVDTLDATFQVTGDTAIAAAGYLSYQWLDCGQGMAIIPGATHNMFIPAVSGHYAVMTTSEQCVDTAACQYIQVIGIAGLVPPLQLKPYPIPARDHITIEGLPAGSGWIADIHQLSGQKIRSVMVNEPNTMNLSGIPPGSYVCRIHNPRGSSYRFTFIIL